MNLESRGILKKYIDILKIDIEGLERGIVAAIPAHNLVNIKIIQYETWLNGNVTLKPA